jgi:predicted type IV restriction endonuclease
VQKKSITQYDQQTYFGILLNDNNRKPFCRVHYNGKKKLVSFFDTDKEERVENETNSQLYEYAARFIKAVEKYEKTAKIANVMEQ